MKTRPPLLVFGHPAIEQPEVEEVADLVRSGRLGGAKRDAGSLRNKLKTKLFVALIDAAAVN